MATFSLTDSKVYSVELIWEITKNSEIKTLRVGDLIHNLDICGWHINTKENIMISPQQFIKNPSLYPYHKKLMDDANVIFPLIVYRYNDKWLIVDGMHRLCKLMLANETNIYVKEITTELLDKTKKEFL